MFSQTTEYALRIVVFMASIDGKPATTAQIAKATATPRQYLAKILRQLARGGIVESQRGLGGGSVLTRHPEDLTVYDVVQIVDPITRITSCPLGLKTHSVRLCPLHFKLDQAISLVEESFRKTSIASMVAEPNRPRPMVEGIPTEPGSGLVPVRVLRKRKSQG